MKNTCLLFFLLFSTVSFAELKISNLSGTWNGQRFQYNESKSAYIAEFEYTYELEQSGDQVTGVARIAKDGAFAEIALRGFVKDDKFYFEEYDVLKAQRKEGYLWCLKKGVLNINHENNRTTLTGTTPSFMEEYGFECSGGVTLLSRDHEIIAENVLNEIAKQDNVSVYPNPYSDYTLISYAIDAKMKVVAELVDVRGQIVQTIFNDVREAGTYTLKAIPPVGFNFGYVRMTLGDRVVSKAIQKVSFDGSLR